NLKGVPLQLQEAKGALLHTPFDKWGFESYRGLEEAMPSVEKETTQIVMQWT
ncbi:hypothetical protein P7K49_039080, partial [Saguinus oedipus]